MKRLAILLFLCFHVALQAQAQDLNARVQVLSPQVQNTNKRAIQVLEAAIRDFLNGKEWSNDQLKPQERIDCSFLVNITEWDGSSNFRAELQVQSSRPVFGATYQSTLLNFSDKDFNFSYIEGQALDFSDQQYTSNLSALLAYYAYIIVGLDHDTFSLYGGSPYFSKAQTIVNYSQNAPNSGWKAFEGLRNRYWLIENLTNKDYQPIRNFIYGYHRNGLDMMSENPKKGRNAILSLLPELLKIDRQRQGAMLNQVLFTAKADELVQLLNGASPQEKKRALSILSSVDPSNIRKYDLLKSNQ